MARITLEIDRRVEVEKLLNRKVLYDMRNVARITGYGFTYLRRLCHAGKVEHHKILGRYYMTPTQVADLLSPVAKDKQIK